MKKYDMIGKILEDGTVEKEYCGQGNIYKNGENFEKKEGICYIGEYGSDNVNTDDDFDTYQSMLEETKQAYIDFNVDQEKHPIEKTITTVFEMLDWQCFSSLLYEVINCLEDEEENA